MERDQTQQIPVKIGFDAHVLDGKFQGTQTVILRLSEALARQAGVEVFLYAARARPSRPEHDGRLTYKFLRPASALRRLLWEMPRLSFRDRLDSTIFQYISPAWARRSAVVIHDILPITHWHLFRLKFVFRSAVFFTLSMILSRTIFVPSEYTSRQIKKIFPVFRSKVHVVRNGPSFDEFNYFRTYDRLDTTSVTGGRRFALAVGRIEKRKNIDMAARAFVKAGLEGICFVVVGKVDDGFDISLEDSRIVHLQDVDESMLLSLYANADLFIYPSEAEGFGLPLLDAVLFGVPTLSSDRTAMPEVGGTLAEYFDPKADGAEALLSIRIREHFTSGAVRRPSQQERHDHARKFSWDQSGSALLSVVRR